MPSVINQNDLEVKEKIKISPPKMYKVILLNDDYTPFNVVVEIIREVFGKNMREAMQIMDLAHRSGKAICGIFPKEIAIIKVEQVHEIASEKRVPLQATTEEDK